MTLLLLKVADSEPMQVSWLYNKCPEQSWTVSDYHIEGIVKNGHLEVLILLDRICQLDLSSSVLHAADKGHLHVVRC